MKRTILSGLAITALLIGGSAAYAADMAVKAPMPVAEPVNSWTGFYFDVDAGWERSGYNWTYVNAPAFPGFGMSSTDGVFGAHIGYQQQFGWAVLGLEAGGSATANAHNASVTSPSVTGPCSVTGTRCSAFAGDVSTFGGKLGVAWQDWLVYAVGGAAFGANVSTASFTAAGAPFDNSSRSYHGSYYGGGVDFMAFKTRLIDLIAGVEYEHINLGTQLQTSPFDGFSPAGVNARSVSANENIVWGKLTVKWNPLGM